jgi:hypothetical protein
MAKTKEVDPVERNDQLLQMSFELIPVKKINPAKYNPRKDLQPSDPEYQNIKQSIRTHGLADPLIWNKHNGVLIGGHQRLKILVDEFHAEQVWCSVRNIKDEREEISLNSALNKNQGEWDFLKLKDVLQRFVDEAPDSPLRAAMGFALPEFEGIMNWQPRLTTVDDLESTPGDRFATFEAGAIKQIVLYFDGKEFGGIVERLEAVRKKENVQDNSAAFVRLLERYENNRVAKKAHTKKTARRNGK